MNRYKTPILNTIEGMLIIASIIFGMSVILYLIELIILGVSS